MEQTELKKGRLSNDDFNVFKESIYMTDKELAILLNRSESFITNTRQRVYPNKKTGKWTKDDIDTLKYNSKHLSVAELSRYLNRTEKAISSKLKIIKPKDNPYIQDKINAVEEEVFSDDCCGEDCCDHENKKDSNKLSLLKRFINFFKVW